MPSQADPITAVAAAVPIHQSRWGFHPCGHDTFAQLKAYHQLLFRDMQATRRHARWEVKLPHNRRRRLPDGRIEPSPEPVFFGTNHDYYLWVLAEYRNARRPARTPGEVIPLDLPHGWAANHKELQAFYALA